MPKSFSNSTLTCVLITASNSLLHCGRNLRNFPRMRKCVSDSIRMCSSNGWWGESLREILAKVGNIPLKKIAVPLGVVLAIVIAFFAVSSCHEKVKAASVADSIEEMQQKALQYMDAQKAYFARNKVVGNATALQMADSLSTSSFEYTISGGRFTAVSKVPFENCPAGTKWSVSASTKGFFEKELVLYRSAPKDSACARLTPDFKKLGR